MKRRKSCIWEVVKMSRAVNSILFSGYKSFDKESQFEIKMMPYVSVFIGKNNGGKSTCLDVIESVFEPEYYIKNRGDFSKVSISFSLDNDNILDGFSKNAGGGDVPGGGFHYDYGKGFIGKNIYADLSSTRVSKDIYPSLELSSNQTDLKLPHGRSEWERVIRGLQNYYDDYEFRRINADRDIVSEISSPDDILEYDGTGATNILRRFINHSQYNEKFVEELLLEELNLIMAPDSQFRSIRVQEIDVGSEIKWEIFLEEFNGKRFALSKSGSGLKTIILMLINLHIIPHTKNYKDKKIIYAFEELENNLHPALQRKVFNYLYDFAKKNDVRIFITTHSHIAINTYFDKKDAEIYHIVKNEKGSQLSSISGREGRMDVLSDLDVRASDLFQSNGIIWVEGPSDRIYINHWLKIFCNSEFLECSDYQFLYYGGKNLSHFTTDESLDELINILTTNQNSAVVIDSDKKKPRDRINSTKARIKREMIAIGAICWITEGKEIENYLSTDALKSKFGDSIPELKQYTLFPEYIEKYFKNFRTQKVKFAKEILEHITADNSESVLDLKKRIEELYTMIKKWNHK